MHDPSPTQLLDNRRWPNAPDDLLDRHDILWKLNDGQTAPVELVAVSMLAQFLAEPQRHFAEVLRLRELPADSFAMQ